MRLIYEVYFALKGHKVLHQERYYIVTYNIVNQSYCVWYVDGFGFVRPFAKFREKFKLDFTWNILMNRSESICP